MKTPQFFGLVLLLAVLITSGWVTDYRVQQSQDHIALVEPSDTEAPAIPSGLVATAVTQTSVTLAWNAATDNVGVAGYRLYEYVRINPYYSHWLRRLDHIATESVTVTGLGPGSMHKYAVTAYDAAGNESARSATLPVTTLQPPVAYHPVSSSHESVQAIVGELFIYDVDALGVPAPTFALVAGPAGLTVDPLAGLVQWTPTPGDQGTATATVRASNSQGTDDHTFSFPVYPAGTDVEPPGPVRNVVATDVTSHGATLTWDSATDNVGVVGYTIKAQKDGRGNSLFTAGESEGPGTTYTVTGLESNTGYRLWVAASDAAGNVASISGVPAVPITTLASPPSEECYVDMDEVKSVVNLWHRPAGPPHDCDGDGMITSMDIMCWVRRLGEACP